jgi:hypothetical protein
VVKRPARAIRARRLRRERGETVSLALDAHPSRETGAR